MRMELIITLVLVLAIISIVDKLYVRVNLDNYSPVWEYFTKAFLYSIITVFTLFYGKESFQDVTPVEWAIIAVSAIEATGNYINYVFESKKRKDAKSEA